MGGKVCRTVSQTGCESSVENVEDIMGLDVEETKRDFVVWEGNPLEFGASVVLGVDGEDGMVSMCWPESN